MTPTRIKAVRNCASSRHMSTRCGWCLPPAVRKFANRLFSQQLWCWGQDVTHSTGNLLMRYGFERYRTPDDPQKGSTCYRTDQDEKHVALWGFGAFFGTRRLGGLYIARYDFLPLWGEIESVSYGVHSPDDLPAFHRPRRLLHWRQAHRLLSELLRWIADYERWVTAEVGPLHRQSCITRWNDPVVPGELIANAWRTLSRRSWEQEDWNAIRDRLKTMEKRP